MAILLAKHCDIPIRHHATEEDFFEENWGIVPSVIGQELSTTRSTTQAKGAACTTLLLPGIRLLHPCYSHMAASRSMQLFKVGIRPHHSRASVEAGKAARAAISIAHLHQESIDIILHQLSNPGHGIGTEGGSVFFRGP